VSAKIVRETLTIHDPTFGLEVFIGVGTNFLTLQTQ
jgi:hypothetical protein